MRVLIVKTSSMGDIIHALPALTDAGKMIPGIVFDWVVEENFAEIPHWHPLVNKVIPVALRRWRKALLAQDTRRGWKALRTALRAEAYDRVIDAQGLLKSAIVATLARGPRVGGDWSSARDPFASLFYQRKCRVSQEQHAVVRMRSLFAQALGYAVPDTVPDYGVDRRRFLTTETPQKYVVFLHGTTWATKHWPEEYWIALAKMAEQQHIPVKLSWGNAAELARAERIAQQAKNVEILPRLDLQGLAGVLSGAQAIVAVDTGLGHLAAALNVPTVSLYGPTNPSLTGAMGASQVHLSVQFPCAPCLNRVCTYSGAAHSPLYPPCFKTLPPEWVWATLAELL